MTKILPLFAEEYDLAKAIKQGNEKAMKVFYQRYSSKMLAICTRYLTDKMTAEDVMIEAMMKVFKRIDQFNFQGSFEGWVKRIMVNESLMKLRSQKIVEIDIEDVNYKDFAVENQDNLSAEDLMNLITALPVGYRTVFNMYAIEGYSHAEIAEKLGISEGTSKSQLSRARGILQQKLKELELESKGNLK